MKTNLNVDTQVLREKILDLAMRGKLVKQDAGDEPASVLLEKIKAEKAELVKEGKIKKGKKLPEITEDEKPFDIPDSWEWVRLGDVFDLKSGKNIKASLISENQNKENPYPCFGGNGVRGFVSDKNRSGHYAIIGRQGALCGNINVANGQFYATEHAVVVEHFDLTVVEWGAIFLKALNLNQYATSTAQPGLAVSKINLVLIPLPPLAEQKRIADKVSELFKQVDVIEKNVAEYQDLERAMRSKLLDLAMRGKLVDQDPSDEPASELLKQIQAEKAELVKEGKIKKSKKLTKITDDEKPFDIPDSWEWVRLGNICTKLVDGDHKELYNFMCKDEQFLKLNSNWV